MDGGTAAIHEHRLQLIDGNCSHARHPDFQSTSLIIRNRLFVTKSVLSVIRETAPHLCLNCYFAVEVWLKVKEWTGLQFTVPDQACDSFADWWHGNLSSVRPCLVPKYFLQYLLHRIF